MADESLYEIDCESDWIIVEQFSNTIDKKALKNLKK